MKALLAAILLFSSSFLFGQTTKWFVDASNTGTQDGTSWSTAFQNLQDAIDAANPVDSVFIAKGTYYPTQTLGNTGNDRDKAFLLKSDVLVYGGFDGTENNLQERGFDSTYIHMTNPTILSGDIGIAGDTADNAYHVAVASGVGVYFLNGLTISHGNADGQDSNTAFSFLPRNGGGGIINLLGETHVSQTNFIENLAYRGGGAALNANCIANYEACHFQSNRVNSDNGSHPESGGGAVRNVAAEGFYDDCVFHDNLERHSQGGGAMRNENSNVTIGFCSFSNNRSIDGDGGAAIYCALNSDAEIWNTTFKFNTTTDQGGGMYCDNSKPKLSRCLFLENEATGGAGAMENDGGSDVELQDVRFISNTTADNGGAIQNWKSNPQILNCLFDGNYAGNDGGALFNYNTCSPWVTNSIFRNNQAEANGGAIYNRRDCNPVLTNLLIYGNNAGDFGGGIYSVESNSAPCSPIATNLTITENTAGVSGGGAFDDGAGNSKLRNSIVYNNEAPANPEVDAPVASISSALFFSIIGTEYYVSGSNPPTPFSNVVFLNAFNENFRLALGSPGIDAGDNAYYNGSAPNLSGITLDLDSLDRFQGSAIDLGAYESCADTGEIEISIQATPNDTIYEGAIITLQGVVSNVGNNPVYQWFRNGSPIINQTALNYTAEAGVEILDGDDFQLRVQSSMPCLLSDSAYSNIVTMYVKQDTLPGGVAEQGAEQLSIYPNPASTSLDVSITSGYQSLKVLDALGRIQYKLPESDQSNRFRIETSSWSDGVYIIILDTDQGIEVRKLIVKK